jgi:hypothetical protein
VTKRTGITERVNTEFRAEFFNIFNNVNFNLPNANQSSAQFGRITSALDPRIIQFGFKVHSDAPCFYRVLLVSAVLAQTPEDLTFTAAIGKLGEISRALPKYFIAEARLTRERSSQSIRSMCQMHTSTRYGGRSSRMSADPERTPLNAKVIGGLERDQYRIEEVIFESQPGFT